MEVEEKVCRVPYTTCRMVAKEHVKCVPHVTCKMEPYCETQKICRRIPICVPVCGDPCPPAMGPIAPSPFRVPSPNPLPPVTEK
jgi:hypothetical protein